MDAQKKGELNIEDLKDINRQLKYGYTDEQLWDIIHSVGGFMADTISFDRFNVYVKSKIRPIKN